MRRFIIPTAVVVAACWWLGCVALYVSALAGRSEMVPSLFIVMLFGSGAVGVLAGHALRLSDTDKLSARPLVPAVCVAGLLCMALQTAVNWRIVFGNLSGGATSGEPGDRYLNSHGTRVRDLTEEEYQYVEAAKWRQMTAFFVGFSSIALGMALHARHPGRTQSAAEGPLQQTG